VSLLAAGKGKRLRPLTYLYPKPTIPLAGISLLEYYLLLLSRLGVDEIKIVVGHLSNKIVRHVKSSKVPSLRLDFINQSEQLGTGHAVSLLRESVGEESFLLIYSDVFIRAEDLKRLLQTGLSSEFDHVVAVARVDEPWKFGVVLEESGLLKGIIEKPPKGTEPSNKVIAGAFYFNSSIFSYIEELSKSPRGEYELTDAIQEAARRGERVGVLDLRGGWTDAGTFSNLLEASQLLFQELASEKLYLDLKLPYREGMFGPGIRELYPEVSMEGPVFIGENVKIGRGSIIGPYTVLYRDIVIEEGSRISNSIILREVSVKRGSIIEGSIIGDRCYIGKEVRLKRKPKKGEFGMVLGKAVHIDDFTEVSPGTVWA